MRKDIPLTSRTPGSFPPVDLHARRTVAVRLSAARAHP